MPGDVAGRLETVDLAPYGQCRAPIGISCRGGDFGDDQFGHRVNLARVATIWERAGGWDNIGRRSNGTGVPACAPNLGR